MNGTPLHCVRFQSSLYFMSVAAIVNINSTKADKHTKTDIVPQTNTHTEWSRLTT